MIKSLASIFAVLVWITYTNVDVEKKHSRIANSNHFWICLAIVFSLGLSLWIVIDINEITKLAIPTANELATTIGIVTISTICITVCVSSKCVKNMIVIWATSITSPATKPNNAVGLLLSNIYLRKQAAKKPARIVDIEQATWV